MKSLLPLLEDPEPGVRRSGIFGLGAGINPSIDLLISFQQGRDCCLVPGEKNASVRDVPRKVIDSITSFYRARAP